MSHLVHPRPEPCKPCGGYLKRLQHAGSSSDSVASKSNSSFCSVIAALKKRHVRVGPKKKKQQPSPCMRLSKDDSIKISTLRREKKICTKKVRFARSGKRMKIESCRNMSLEQKAALWYSPTERDVLKREARCAAVALQPQYTDDIDQVFRSARYLACISDGQETETLLNDHSVLSRSSKVLLNWFGRSEDEACRGLESRLSAPHRYWREELAKDSRDLVADQYHESQTDSLSSEEEETARQYQEMSRVSVILARLFGDADAVAAGQT